MTNLNSIGIHFIDLDVRERAIFDRVIAFSVTHGLTAHSCENIDASNLVILSESAYSQVEHFANQKILLVISNSDTCALGDKQIKRPLLITRVMNTLGDAIKLVKAVPQNKPAEEKRTELAASEDQTENSNKNTEVDVVVENNDEQQGLHALVIDDSAAIRKQLELELRDAGISSDFAASGEEALEKIAEKLFDLVFLDIIMPGIDGYETCKSMRATANYKKTPIIMLSGKTSPLDEVQGVIAGATTYLTKPVKRDKLQVTIARVTKWINNYAEEKNKKTETA